MKTEQLLLFEDPKSEYQSLWEKYIQLKDSQDKTRKRLFRELQEVRDVLVELRAENERLKAVTEPQKPQFFRWSA